MGLVGIDVVSLHTCIKSAIVIAQHAEVSLKSEKN